MTANSTINHRPGLRLQDGERILKEGSPVPRMASAMTWKVALWFGLTVLFLPLTPFVPMVVRHYLGWHRWWLTDRRLVVRTGFIGWQVRSVPLDRIVDVTTQASWWDRLWGVQHIKVRDMTGEVSNNQLSTGLLLIGVENAELVADAILANTQKTAIRSDDLSGVVNLLEQLVSQKS